MEFGPEWPAIGMHRRIAAARVRAGVEINLELSVTGQIGDRRFGIGQPLAEVIRTSQKRRRIERLSGCAINSAIHRVKHFHEVGDTVAVDVGDRRDATAEGHGRFFRD